MKIVRLNENDLIRLVKRVINEENKKQKMNELFGKKKKEKDLKEPTDEEIRAIDVYFNQSGTIGKDNRSNTPTEEYMINLFSGNGFDATEAFKTSRTTYDLYEKLGFKYPGNERINRVMDNWREKKHKMKNYSWD